MAKKAFKDAGDGYYEVDIPAGAPVPEWAKDMTPCAVQPVVPTEAETVAIYTAKVQARLDDFAKTRNYDSMLSACTYATSTVPRFAQEAAYCVDMRDATWSTCYGIVAAVKAGNRPMPTWAQIESELPALSWPIAE